MYKIIIALVSFMLSVSSLDAQTTQYHRVRIDLKDKNPLLLLKAGITLDHGKYAVGRYFESDLSDEEIKIVDALGFNSTLLIRDVETYYAKKDRPSEIPSFFQNKRDNACLQLANNYKTPKNYFDGSMGGYFTYEEMVVILEWMQTSYPNIISKLDTIDGYTTNDGNKILYLRVSDNPNVEENEPEVLYTALHHAREPNSLSQMIFYLWYLLENYDSDPEIKYLVDNTEMFFIPCVNPDGYKLNHKNRPNGGGMWRKNTTKDASGKVTGVDLNRNYGFEWGYDNIGSSTNPNSDTYRGTGPFSEVETSAIREFCILHNFVIALNYHTYGNLLIHPWGYNDLPTDEDLLFKGLGNVMTEENNFKMGTGTETVGYTVNGDSDDYMYGDQAEKNKIYSYTPEVGPSFWPAAKDIDQLNKSCLHMNLSLPRLVNALIDHKYVAESSQYQLIDTASIIMYKPSFKREAVNVELYIDPAYSNSPSIQLTLDLSQGEETLIKYPFAIKKSSLLIGKNDVNLYIKKQYDNYQTLDSIELSFFNGETDSILYDNAESFSNWITNGQWGTTSLPDYFVSAPSSITDSPSTLYARNTTNRLVLKSGLDLSNAIDPLLTFKARWNIEKSFDYAIIYAVSAGNDTTYLCGQYTKSGTGDQKAGHPIYDGDQLSFVTEIMSLEEVAGKHDVKIIVEMVSDAFLEMDGIYIDDVEILSFVPTQTNVSDNEISSLRIFPNPASTMIHISGNPSMLGYAIYDTNGRNVQSGSVNTSQSIDISKISNGIYQVQLTDIEGKTNAYRVIVVK